MTKTAAEWLIQAATNGSTGGSTAEEIASAVRTELAPELANIDTAVSTRVGKSDMVGANVLSIRGQPITGTGTPSNPWRPA